MLRSRSQKFWKVWGRSWELEILERSETGVGVGYFTFDSATLLKRKHKLS